MWGLVCGPQKGALDLRFEIPSRCADLLRNAEVDIGLVPVIELERQRLEPIANLGIASLGPVRSILLISKGRPERIRRLAVDASSRTSVVLARILLKERYGIQPEVIARDPDVKAMLVDADACLVIGDPALRVEQVDAEMQMRDLGAEWTEMTGLPMVFAVWAAREGCEAGHTAEVLRASWAFGRERIAEIARTEATSRGVTVDVAQRYLTENIRFELDGDSMEGLALFRRLAREGKLV